MLFKRATLLFLTIILLNSIGIKSSNLDYILSIIYLLIFLCIRKKIIFHSTISDFLPILMIIIWIYGLILGVMNGTIWYNIIFNYPGILLIILYYPILTAKINLKDLFYLLFITTFLINLYVLIPVFVLNNFTIVFTDLMQNRKYYSVSLILQVISFNTILINNKELVKIKIPSKIIFFSKINSILSLIVLLVSFSKGFWLSLLISFTVINFTSLIYHFKKLSVGITPLLIIISSATLFMIIIINYPDFSDAVVVFFSSDAKGNSLRSQQAVYLSNEFTFFGAGMGTPLRSGYQRDDFGYAFELSFYNIIHKFGFFSFFLLTPYIYLLYKNIRNSIVNNSNFVTIFSISTLSYLISASGNPILFASINIILFILVLYINKFFIIKNNKNV
jgi:hypothetical protein